MSDTMKDKTTQKSSTGKDNVTSTAAPQETQPQETTDDAKAAAEVETERNFLGEAAESIKEGTHKVSEKGAEIGDALVDKLKKGISTAYETGTKVVDELSQMAHEYIEKHKAESEVKKLKEQKDMLMAQLGQSFFRHHLAGGRFAESFLSKQELSDLFNQIDTLDQKIIETGKLLDKEEE